MPAIRGRGRYDQDKATRTRRYYSKMSKFANEEEEETGSENYHTCKKSYKGHKTLMAGIFTVYCEHGRFLVGPTLDPLK